MLRVNYILIKKKRHLPSVIIEEMEIKTKNWFHFIPKTMAKNIEAFLYQMISSV